MNPFPLRLPFGLLVLLTIGCNLPTLAGPTTTATRAPRVTDIPPTRGSAQVEHRIGVRSGDQGMEFYNRRTGQRFVPRGVNYHRWVWRAVPGSGNVQIDSLFNTEFGQLAQAEADLAEMERLGFNAVRVWKNACWGGVGGCIGDPRGGLSAAYLDNIAAFLRMVGRHGIHVIFTDDWIPDDGGYGQTLQRGCCLSYDGYNNVYLTQHGIAAERAYLQNFIRGLIERNAPLDAILTYELKNEAFYESNLPPFSRDSGQVAGANGQTYDLSIPADRRRMMEEGWLFWSDQLRSAILEVDPTAPVTMGFFVQQGPNPVRQGDTRTVYLERMLRESSLEFIDLHAYPGYDLNLRQHAENFTILGEASRLIVMGEFGADKNNYPDADRAAAALGAWQSESCAYGFDGWFVWAWNIQDFWAPLENRGQVGQALSPALNPDPCAIGSAQTNLALFRPATASRLEGPQYGPEKANDGSLGTWWSAGAGPPQWIEIDLGSSKSVGRVVLQPGWVSAAGAQRIRVSVKGPGTDGAYVLFHEFWVDVEANVPIEFAPPQPVTGIRWVKFETLAANGSVIWHEVEVYP